MNSRLPRRCSILLSCGLLGLSGCQTIAPPPKLALPLAPVQRPLPEAALPDGPPVFVPQRTDAYPGSPVWSEDQRTVLMMQKERRIVAVDLSTGFVRGVWDVCARDVVFAGSGSRIDYVACDGKSGGRISLDDGKIARASATELPAIRDALRKARLGAPIDYNEAQSNASGTREAQYAGGQIAILGSGSKEPIARANPCEKKVVVKWAFSPTGTHLLVHCADSHAYHASGGVTLLVGDDLKERYRFSRLLDPPSALQFTPDGRRAGVVASNFMLTVIDVASDQPFESRGVASYAGPVWWSPHLDLAISQAGQYDRNYHALRDATGRELLPLGIGREHPPAEKPSNEPPFQPVFQGTYPPAPKYRLALAFEAGEDQGKPSSYMVVSENGAVRSKVPVGRPIHGVPLPSPDEKLAAVPVWWADFDPKTCPSPTWSSCLGLAVVDIAFGKISFKIPIPGGWESFASFSPDSRMILAGGSVWDAITGKALFTADRIFGTTLRWLGRRPVLLVKREGELSIVDPRTGIVGLSAKGIDSIVDMSPDGAALLVTTAAGEALFDTTSGALRPLAPHPEGHKARRLLQDARFVLYQSPGTAMLLSVPSVLRLTDGRWLKWEGELLVTDEGVFDGEPATWNEGAFRMGPDVLHSRMAPLSELAPRYHHPALEKAFFAAENISPHP